MNAEESKVLTQIETTVNDMHHRLFGNGQPGIITLQDNRLKELEADRNKVLGAVKLVRFLAIILPLLVAGTEGYRAWAATQPLHTPNVPVITFPKER